MTQPLLDKSSLRHEAIPFDKIKDDDFLPALTEAIKTAKISITRIKAEPALPTFDNCIVALENATKQVSHVARVFTALKSAHGTPKLHELAKDIMPQLSAFENDVNLDQALFKKIKSVFKDRNASQLSGEDLRLTEKIYRSFVRNGALLKKKDQDRLRAIDAELALLEPRFSENVLKATNMFELYITNPEELSGLPQPFVQAAAQAAQQRGHAAGWSFTLHMPSYLPFMQNADRRDHRRTLLTEYSKRCTAGDIDNRSHVKRIAELRHERAGLLGYETHAHFQLEERMAETPDRVKQFLEQLLAATKPAADRELDKLKALKEEETGSSDFEDFDFHYYSKRLQQKLFDFDPEDLRPYFELKNVVEGLFIHAQKLYGLKFQETLDLPKYHPDVRVFEVKQETTGEYLGLFYADFHPRDTKKPGAWATTLTPQAFEDGVDHRPHVCIVCNLTSPTHDRPSLLNLDEVETLFHEFGHALHVLLSRCKHRALSGYHVYLDFVELPSQIMENWLTERESLRLFAKHFKTGEPIPDELIEKVERASDFNAALQMLRQLKFGFLDMAWHASDPSRVVDLSVFEHEAMGRCYPYPAIPGALVSTAFLHIFSGSYSAGYYSYKWSEVLDADAFELFKEKGIFNRSVSDSFRSNILERGNSEHPMVLYRRFRGREPDPGALLRRDKLIKNSSS